MSNRFTFGLIRNVKHLKEILRHLNVVVFEYEKEKRFQVFEVGKNVEVMIMNGLVVMFKHRVRNGEKVIDVSYRVKEGCLNYYIGTFEFKRYSTKAHITQFVMSSLLGIMFDKLLLMGLVEWKGEEIRKRIENSESEYDKVYWESVLVNLKKRYMGLKSGESEIIKKLGEYSIQL